MPNQERCIPPGQGTSFSSRSVKTGRFILICAILSGLLFSSFAQERGEKVDLLISENPRAFKILNKYQQEANYDDLQRFQAYRPMVIVAADSFLSDGYTPCTIVKLDRSTFFLEKNQEQELLNASAAGETLTLTKVTVVNDTVVLQRDVNLSRLPSRSVDNESGTATKETLLLRQFRHRGLYLVASLSGPTLFGWVTMPASPRNRIWRKFVPEAVTTTLDDGLTRRLKARVDTFNKLIVQLFDHHSMESGRKQAAPQWQASENDGSLAFQLSDPLWYEKLSTSIDYLVLDLENVLLGSKFKVSRTDTHIEIIEK